MAKFCGNCGCKMEDGAAFCPECGKPMKTPSQPTAVQNGYNSGAALPKNFDPTRPASEKKKINVKVLLPVAAVAVVVIVLIAAFSGSGPDKAVKKFMRAFEKGDVEAMVELAPLDIGEEVNEDEFYIVYRLVVSDIKGDYGDRYSIDYDIAEKVDALKTSDDSEIEELKNENNVKGIWEYHLNVTISGDGRSDTEELEMLVIKVKGKWKVICDF